MYLNLGLYGVLAICTVALAGPIIEEALRGMANHVCKRSPTDSQGSTQASPRDSSLPPSDCP